MSKYIIKGGSKLTGKISISGNKNAVLPCLAAALLTEDEVIIRNVPKISDVDVFLEIFQSLGVKSERGDSFIKIHAKKITSSHLPQELSAKLRAAILFAGPLLARIGKAEFSHPGGDVIGKRSIDAHIKGLRDLGFVFEREDRKYIGKKKEENLKFYKIFLEEASVTATENLLLAAALNPATVILQNCAQEPHVIDLCNMLIKMGASIEGVGSSLMKITGREKLKGVDFSVGLDYVEFGTYAIAAAITGGKIEIEKSSLEGMEPVINPLMKMGLEFNPSNGSVFISAGKINPTQKIITNIWPGFPTDLMSVVIILASQANGVSLLHDWMYESRMFFVDKLISMGAHITIADPHRVIVSGPSKLIGRNLETPDIRAGMALILAAVIATGESTINRVELIDRGYEDVVGKLSSLGVNIQKIS